MSITLDKLRALKRQAGEATATSRRASVPSTDRSRRPDIHPHPVADAASVREGADALGVAMSLLASDDHAAPPAPLLRDDENPTAAARARPEAAPGDDPPEPGVTRARRAAPGRAVGGAPAATSLHTLRRLLGVRERQPFLPPTPRAPLDRTLPGTEIAPGLHCIETRLPFAAPAAALPLAFARRETHVDPRALLFFDTETTGLAGGTGTRAFMIGAADWVDDTLRIRQLLISTMAAETAMLREFATWLSPDTVLTSYNGRSYDAPLLKTRYRLARLPDPLHALDHLDLLHPTRRRYRGRWENCRLATIERELLKIVREDDLPGSQAPMAWLGFLRGGASTLLQRVAAHNHQDVVTLARLLLRLVEAQAAD
jgi:uncharacterized protein YprB with RNaseH-like and TPR domain